jgi:sugar-specific transcriptional regulator TrmB
LSDLLALLKQAGLNEYESKAYGVLLETDSASAADVSRRAGIPRARVYDVLVGLEKKGFLAQEPSRPVRFSAFHPEIALNNLALARKQVFASEISALAELKGVIGKHADSLKKTQLPASEGETAFLVSGKQNIDSKIEELLKNASKEAVICTVDEDLQGKSRLLARILEENPVDFPISVCVPVLDQAVGKGFEKLSKVELSQGVPGARFMVFDGKKSLLFLSNEKKDEEKALLIDSKSVASLLKASVKK